MNGIGEFLAEPSRALLAGIVGGALFTIVVNFVATELSAAWSAGRRRDDEKTGRVRAALLDDVIATRDYCDGYISACLAWRLGDAKSYLEFFAEPRYPNADLALLGSRELSQRFRDATHRLRAKKFDSGIGEKELVAVGRLLVDVRSGMHDQRQRVLEDGLVHRAPRLDTAEITAEIARNASLMPPRWTRRVAEWRRAFLLSLLYPIGLYILGVSGRVLRHMWRTP